MLNAASFVGGNCSGFKSLRDLDKIPKNLIFLVFPKYHYVDHIKIFQI